MYKCLKVCRTWKYVLWRWEELQKKSEERREQLDKKLKHFQGVEDKFLLFAKKASSFNSWFENAEEDLSDPVKCNSIDEIKVTTFQTVLLLPVVLKLLNIYNTVPLPFKVEMLCIFEWLWFVYDIEAHKNYYMP